MDNIADFGNESPHFGVYAGETRRLEMLFVLSVLGCWLQVVLVR
jgi:hypothetical protein